MVVAQSLILVSQLFLTHFCFSGDEAPQRKVHRGLNSSFQEHERNNETDSAIRYRPVLKRYESAHNMVDSFYKEAGFRVALLDIILWKEKDEIKKKNGGPRHYAKS